MIDKLRSILIRNNNVEEQIEQIVNLYADHSDVEKIHYWRNRYYSTKRTNENISKKLTVANDKLRKIKSII